MSTGDAITCERPSSRPAPPWAALAVLAVLVVCSVTEAQARLPFSPCVFRNATGLPCAGCGMTRGLTAMGHGRLLEAWRMNSLAPVAYVFAWGYVVFAVLAWRFPGVRAHLRPRPRLSWALFAVVLAAVLISWATTLAPFFS